MADTITKSKAYTQGATIGGVAGFVIAKLANKNWILWSLAGIIIGGYVAHKFTGDTENTETTQFKHYQ
jgi:hypothetical protein